MKKICSRSLSALLLTSFITTSVVAKVRWSGSDVANVINEDLVILGSVTLPAGATVIEAIDRDIVIDIQDKAAKVKGQPHRESQLYLRAENGHKIRFEVDHRIDFIGSEGGKDLLIVQSGLGMVEFAIEQGKDNDVSFTSNDGTGGTQYFVLMGDKYSDYEGAYQGDEYTDEYTDEYVRMRSHRNADISKKSHASKKSHRQPLDQPVLRFSSLFGDFDKNITIKIGRKSRLSFIADDRISDLGEDKAMIEFDPTNHGLGRMVLEVANTGSFTVAGHHTRESNATAIKLDDIDLKTAAGLDAQWAIVNSSGPDAHASLLVLNRNKNFFDLLFDPFGNLGTRSASSSFRGSFDGERLGVVIGANASLLVGSNSYLDFVGLLLNKTPNISSIPGQDEDTVHLIKMRNPSALFIDGNHNPNAVPAKITLGEHSAIFFRSGVATDRSVRKLSSSNPFTVDPSLQAEGEGYIVFDVEGRLDVFGPEVDGSSLSKIELLSLEVAPTGGSLLVGTTETNFPLRTFEKDGDVFFQYNCGAFLINNQLNLFNTSLSHTDQCHEVFQKNDARSEPSYIGGETFQLRGETIRPSINFYNSVLHLNTDAAVTGVDLVVPNLVDDAGACEKNLSSFVFYYNGFPIDSGTGRTLILGTLVGSLAGDGCTVINCDAHLDVMQRDDCLDIVADPNDPEGNHTLQLTTAANDTSINEDITNTDNLSIHTIYLGCSSNISIGTNADTTGFENDTNPWLHIQGNFFSFESRGGQIRRPDTASITGMGGIFVDLNGRISIDSMFRANIATMVTKSRNAIIELPSAQVFFDERVGISDWMLDLSKPDSNIIVASGQNISDYTLNWVITKKDFPNFLPYETGNATLGECPPAQEANVTSLPTVQGIVDQLQLQATRLGDPAHIMVDGGHVRELVFSDLNLSSEAPVAIVAIKNDGRVGLGSGHKSRDSLDATTTLGINGVTVIADGESTVDLNEDIFVNNICAFVKGPNFQEGNVLFINSDVPRELRVKSTGSLDFTSFDSPTDIVEFGGELTIVIEPGATLITGAGTIRFSGNAQVIFEPARNVAEFFNAIPLATIDNTLSPLAVVDASQPHNQFASLTNFGAGLANTDQFRVRIIGGGTLEFVDNAKATIPFNAFVGIETLSTSSFEVPTTNINVVLRDNSDFLVGELDNQEGGVLQVGNVADLGPSHSVNFTLTLDGNDARFVIGRLGFVGLGVGVERAITGSVPNDLMLSTMSNVGSINFVFNNGEFKHDRIFAGDDERASLLAFSGDEAVSYNLTFQEIGAGIDDIAEQRVSNFDISGGGNIVLIQSGEGAISPIVLTDDGTIEVEPGVDHPRLQDSIMASTSLQDLDENEAALSGATLFDELKTHDAVLEVERSNTLGLANAAQETTSFRQADTQIRLGTVSNGIILRESVSDVIEVEADDTVARERAIDQGAVFVNIDPETNAILTATNF